MEASLEKWNMGPHSVGRLLAYISKYTRSFMSRRLHDHGVDGSTYGFLFHLYNDDGITESELTRHMLVDKATTTRAVAKLLKGGYVRKEQDPNDRRAYRIYLTKAASDLESRLNTVKSEWMEIVLMDFSGEERDTLLDFLERMERNLRESGTEEGI
jgi:DNA-binding MarR family transcriptional regulator